MRERTYIVDLSRKTYQIANYKQFDENINYSIKVIENSLGVDLSGCEIVAFFTREDGYVIQKNCKINKDVVTTILDYNILSVVGKVNVEFIIYKNKIKVTTFDLGFYVNKSVNCNQKIIEQPMWDLVNEVLKINRGQVQKYLDTLGKEVEDKFLELSSKQQQDSEVIEARKGEINLKAKINKIDENININENETASSKAINLFGINKRFLKDRFGFYSINFAGDSITQGYNSSDHFKKSYMSLMRNALQNEYNTTNIGFVNVHPTGYYQELSTGGEWTNTQDYNMLGNQCLSSIDTIGTVTIKPKFNQKMFAICYEQKEGNGSFDISVNDVLKTTVDCNGELDYCKKTININLEDGATIKISKKDNKRVAISGLWYFDDPDKIMINNYARSGATLSDMGNHVLDAMCDCNVLFMALNHNDSDNRIDEYTEKINHIRDRVKVNNVFTILLDFKWGDKDSLIKRELKRVYNELKNNACLYYDIGKELWNNDLYYMRKYSFLMDGDNSHPTDLGMEILARGLCKLIGISSNFKRKIYFNTNWNYVGKDAEFENGWTNSFDNYTRFKKVDDVVYLEFYIKNGESGQRCFKLPKGFRPKFNFRTIVNIFDEGGSIKYNRVEIGMDGSVIPYFNAYASHTYGIVSFVSSN